MKPRGILRQRGRRLFWADEQACHLLDEDKNRKGHKKDKNRAQNHIINPFTRMKASLTPQCKGRKSSTGSENNSRQLDAGEGDHCPVGVKHPGGVAIHAGEAVVGHRCGVSQVAGHVLGVVVVEAW